MTVISDVFILDVSDNEDLEYRDTKYCVCVSVLNNKCLLINSKNSGIYDELEIDSSDYDPQGGVRFVACKNIFEFSESEIIRKLGNLNYANMKKILDMLKAKNRKQLADIITELDEWISGYSQNKLLDAYKNR